MELNSHTMSTYFSDYRISVFYCMFMNCTSHISNRSPWFHLGNTNLNTFFVTLTSFSFSGLTYRCRTSGRVRIITIIYCRYINIDNISSFRICSSSGIPWHTTHLQKYTRSLEILRNLTVPGFPHAVQSLHVPICQSLQWIHLV